MNSVEKLKLAILDKQQEEKKGDFMKKIIFTTEEYEETYGKKPRGIGNWAFYFMKEERNRKGEMQILSTTEAWLPSGYLTFAEAKKLATEKAKELGANVVSVGT